MQESLEQQNII